MCSEKKDVIVYGLGNEFEYLRLCIEKRYNILGYADSDSGKAKVYQPFISVDDIKKRNDGIFIASIDYYDEIRNFLIAAGVDEGRIVVNGLENVIGTPVIVVTLWGGFSAIMTGYCFAKALQKYNPGVPLYFELDYFDIVTKDLFKGGARNFEKLFNIPLYSQRADEDTFKRARRQGFIREKPEDLSIYHEEYINAKQGFFRGYWGTRKYYANIESEIADWFEFDTQYMSDEQRRVLGRIKDSEEAVAVWVRRGDFMNEANYSELGCVCGEEYFNKAIAYMKEKHPNAEFFIFSTDSDYIREKYSEYNLMLYEEGTSDMIDYDMYLMASCKHMILANSGFSWWAAYLHDLHGIQGTVIAPKEWVKGRKCSDIWEDSWIKM